VFPECVSSPSLGVFSEVVGGELAGLAEEGAVLWMSLSVGVFDGKCWVCGRCAWLRMLRGIGDDVWTLRRLTSESASMADLVDVLDIVVAVPDICDCIAVLTEAKESLDDAVGDKIRSDHMQCFMFAS